MTATVRHVPITSPHDVAAEPPALEITGLTKVYDDGTLALDDLSLTVPAGGFHGLLGPNGSGKSTLIGIITGLVRGPAGHVKVFGHDAVSDHRLARTMVGLAPQEVHLDRFLTARDVLSFHGRYFGMSKADAIERADELLVSFDLENKAGSRPNRLSGGMRRRLLIARALVHRPRLAILDEPTAGVDLELRHDLWQYLSRIHREEGTTVLLTTHYLEEAEALCGEIAMIREGRIIVEGTVSEIMNRFGAARLEDAYMAAMQENREARGQTPPGVSPPPGSDPLGGQSL
jgi:ABC-2 type transport system ATP-binding protein